MNKHTFEKGTYYIGDPCYVFSDKHWDSLIDQTGCFGLEINKNTSNWNDGIFLVEGQKCFASATAYGDGVYTDKKRKYSFPVDAGLISIIPFAVQDNDGSGAYVYFFDQFEVYAEDGVFHFGHILIDTTC